MRTTESDTVCVDSVADAALRKPMRVEERQSVSIADLMKTQTGLATVQFLG